MGLISGGILVGVAGWGAAGEDAVGAGAVALAAAGVGAATATDFTAGFRESGVRVVPATDVEGTVDADPDASAAPSAGVGSELLMAELAGAGNVVGRSDGGAVSANAGAAVRDKALARANVSSLRPSRRPGRPF